MLRDRSIIVHSSAVAAPAPGDPSKGAHLYNEGCLHCHGAPGISAEPFSRGLYPAPADLLSGSIQKEWNGAQLYWIVANGIKLTGMPAFGPTYDKDEIEAVPALVQRLPKLSPVEYGQMAGSGHHEHHPTE